MNLPKRKRIRIESFDYSHSGYYFITICTEKHEYLLGNIIKRQELCSCRLTKFGDIAKQEIENMHERFNGIYVDKYVIMPNHIHLILNLRQEQSPCPTISDAVCALKSISTKTANKIEDIVGRKLWQFRFHDHIIRNELEYQKIWQYIDENPLRWEQDCFYKNT